MQTKCDCGHEIEFADYYAGRLTKCTECQQPVPLVPSYPMLRFLQSGFRVAGIMLFVGVVLLVMLSKDSSSIPVVIGTMAGGAVAVLMMLTISELLEVVMDYVGRAK